MVALALGAAPEFQNVAKASAEVPDSRHVPEAAKAVATDARATDAKAKH
jgi:hypothetical protein